MTEKRQPGQRRFRLSTWCIVLLIVVMVLGMLHLSRRALRDNNERRLEALRAAGYPASFAELAEYTKLPPGVNNAAEVYRRAFAAYVPPADEANVPLLGKATLPDRSQPLPESMVRAMDACLEGNRQCLALLHEAAATGECWYGWDSNDYMAEGGLHAKDYQSSALLLRLNTILRAHQNDAAGVVTSVEDGLRLANSLRRQGVLITYLVRIGCAGAALVGLERALSVAESSDQQLAELDKVLATTAETTNLADALVGERCYMIELCRSLSSLTIPGGALTHSGLDIMVRISLRDTLNFTGECLDAARLPGRQRLARFSQMDRDVNDLTFALHPARTTLAPAMKRVAPLDLRFHAHVELARSALAVERYRLTNHTLPEHLEALVPEFLNRVPTDPFDGQPIRYRRLETGYLLYSVEADGQDNGGRERSGVKSGDPYDWCFIVRR